MLSEHSAFTGCLLLLLAPSISLSLFFLSLCVCGCVFFLSSLSFAVFLSCSQARVKELTSEQVLMIPPERLEAVKQEKDLLEAELAELKQRSGFLGCLCLLVVGV